jgi:hypothetical protein
MRNLYCVLLLSKIFLVVLVRWLELLQKRRHRRRTGTQRSAPGRLRSTFLVTEKTPAVAMVPEGGVPEEVRRDVWLVSLTALSTVSSAPSVPQHMFPQSSTLHAAPRASVRAVVACAPCHASSGFATRIHRHPAPLSTSRTWSAILPCFTCTPFTPIQSPHPPLPPPWQSDKVMAVCEKSVGSEETTEKTPAVAMVPEGGVPGEVRRDVWLVSLAALSTVSSAPSVPQHMFPQPSILHAAPRASVRAVVARA